MLAVKFTRVFWQKAKQPMAVRRLTPERACQIVKELLNTGRAKITDRAGQDSDLGEQ